MKQLIKYPFYVLIEMGKVLSKKKECVEGEDLPRRNMKGARIEKRKGEGRYVLKC